MEISMAGPEVQRIVAGEQSPLPASREGGEDFSACLAELLLRLELDASLMMAGVSQGEVSEDKNPDDLAAPEPAAFGFVSQSTEAAPGAAPAGDNGAATGAPRPPEGILIPGGLAFPGGPFQDSLKGMEPALTGEGEVDASPASSAAPGLPQEEAAVKPFAAAVAPPLSGEGEGVPEAAGRQFKPVPPPAAEAARPPSPEAMAEGTRAPAPAAVAEAAPPWTSSQAAEDTRPPVQSPVAENARSPDPSPAAEAAWPPRPEGVAGKLGSPVPGKEIRAGLVEEMEGRPEFSPPGRPVFAAPAGSSQTGAVSWPWQQGAGENRSAAVSQLKQSVLEQLNARLAYLPEKGSFPAEIRLQLNPPELGEVIISVAAKRGKMAVEIVTEGALVREIFEAGLAELKQRFQQLNLAVDRIDIFTADQFLDQGGRFHRSSGFPDRVWGFQVPGGEGGEEAAGMPGPTEVYRFGDLTGSGIEFWA